jgi:hypothetical protein
MPFPTDSQRAGFKLNRVDLMGTARVNEFGTVRDDTPTTHIVDIRDIYSTIAEVIVSAMHDDDKVDMIHVICHTAKSQRLVRTSTI